MSESSKTRKRWLESEIKWSLLFDNDWARERLIRIRDHTPWRLNRKSLDELAQMIPELLYIIQDSTASPGAKRYCNNILDLLDHTGYVIEEPEPNVPTELFRQPVFYRKDGIIVCNTLVLLSHLKELFRDHMTCFMPNKNLCFDTKENGFSVFRPQSVCSGTTEIPLAAMIAACEAVE